MKNSSNPLQFCQYLSHPAHSPANKQAPYCSSQGGAFTCAHALCALQPPTATAATAAAAPVQWLWRNDKMSLSATHCTVSIGPVLLEAGRAASGLLSIILTHTCTHVCLGAHTVPDDCCSQMCSSHCSCGCGHSTTRTCSCETATSCSTTAAQGPPRNSCPMSPKPLFKVSRKHKAFNPLQLTLLKTLQHSL
jgi:hypothetical protein